MAKPEPSCGDDFGRAICAHFGLPASQVIRVTKAVANIDGSFGVELELSLTADDLDGIRDLMRNGLARRRADVPDDRGA